MAEQKQMHSGIVAPSGAWWTDIPRQEKIWVSIAFAWCMVLFAMMPLWHFRGGQNPSGTRAKVAPADFVKRTDRFVKEFQVKDANGAGVVENGLPVVAPPPGSHVYLTGRMWSWYPILKLKKGAEYTLHLSSADLNHGFSLYPMNINFQVVPGYDYGLRVTPSVAGDFRIICNEFCGIGHHMMIGKVVVED